MKPNGEIFRKRELRLGMKVQFPSALVLFGNDTVAPTVWSIAHLATVHSRWIYEKYGTGLGINTMQGTGQTCPNRSLCQKQPFNKQRWFQVFRHDSISKVWLPSRKPSLFAYHQVPDSVMSPRVLNDKLHYCYLGFEKETGQEQCCFCNHDLMAEIKQSVLQGKPTKHCLKYMSKCQVTYIMLLVCSIMHWLIVCIYIFKVYILYILL